MKLRSHVAALIFLAISPLCSLSAQEHADSAEAEFQLARAYLNGQGVPKDVGKALELMKAAAAQGHADAIGAVGYFYSTGTGVPQDDAQAAEWFRKGAEKGSAKAQLNLGKYLLDGKTEPTAESSATQQGLAWIQRAADQGLPEATLSYGRILYFGEHGQAVDYKKAMIYLKITAEQGDPEAQNMLGSMYECGSGTPIDETSAGEWYRKAALQGYLKAQGNLGRLLGPLSESREIRIEALAWLLVAADQAEVSAKKLLHESVPVLKRGELGDAEKRKAELKQLIKK